MPSRGPRESTIRRKAHEHANKLLRRKQARISGKQPARDAAYLEFIRQFHCIACTKGKLWRTEYVRSEAAHTGPHAFGRKASDYTALPLCGFEHHREGKLSYHKLGEKQFERAHGISIAELVAEFNKVWEAAKAAKARAATA